jgi:hypothetical protein
MRKGIGAVLGLALVGLAAVPAQAAEDPSYLTFSGGAFGVRKSDTLQGEFLLQYRPNASLWYFKPHAGAMVTTEGSLYGFAGLLMDFHVGNFVITPSTAIGGYYKGNGVDLGHPAEFRSGIEVAYQFENKSKIGVGVYHMSNLVFGDTNPGAESVTLSYSYPLGF